VRKQDTAELIKYIVESGKRLVERQGKISDIGVTKRFLTEEDIRIERRVKELVSGIPAPGSFYAEEENNDFAEAQSVWIADPISGTRRFIDGTGNYAIVVSHMSLGKVDFAVVYNPTADKLYEARKGQGAFLNNARLVNTNRGGRNIIFAAAGAWNDSEIPAKMREKLEEKYTVFPSQGSFAYNYCIVAEGAFDGAITLTHDTFADFAGSFIARQAGLAATNIFGEKYINQNDRAFVYGNKSVYDELFCLANEVFDSSGGARAHLDRVLGR